MVCKYDLCIGVDVDKALLVVMYRLSQKEQWQHVDFDNNEKGFKKLIQKLNAIQREVHITLEYTGTYHCAFILALDEAKIAYSMVTPKQSSLFAQSLGMVNRNDKADAKALAIYGEKRKPELYQPMDATRQRLKHFVRALGRLQKDHIRESNRLESLHCDPNTPKIILEGCEQRLVAFEQDMTAYRTELQTITDEELEAAQKLTQSVCGIGPTTALALMIATNGLVDFENAKQLVRFIGLNPSGKTSGSTVFKKYRVKAQGGIPSIRALLYMCARSARRYNPTCKALYDRLRAKGKPHRLAMVAVAAKLLKQVFAVVKSGKEYDKNYESQKPKKLAVA